jgi:hypothetical protein
MDDGMGWDGRSGSWFIHRFVTTCFCNAVIDMDHEVYSAST